MANLKQIRKRISTVKSTQKITRAMKMVAGARLNRAQQRIQALRPYAQSTHDILARIAMRPAVDPSAVGSSESTDDGLDFAETSAVSEAPLLARRPRKSVLLLVVSSDRGLCGAFNSNILRRAEQERARLQEAGTEVHVATIGRKARDHFQRRDVELFHVFEDVWDKLELGTARSVARTLLKPFVAQEVDSIVLVYNEFKSAMSQTVVCENLLPVEPRADATAEEAAAIEGAPADVIFEPDRGTLLSHLVPMYLEISILRALYESMASELGARMTAMDSATKNASEMIGKLTLMYNRARQAAITTELMEIIGGADALNG